MKKDHAVPPPQNRGPDGKFVKGNRANPGGRTQKLPEIKEFCRSQSMDGIRKLADIMQSEDTKASDVIAIVRLFLEYGIGKPANEYDTQRIEIDRKLADARVAQIDRDMNNGPQQVEVLISAQAKEWGS